MIVRKMKQAMRKKILPKEAIDTLVDMALAKEVLTMQEHKTLKHAYEAKHDFVQVDSFKIEDYVKKL